MGKTLAGQPLWLWGIGAAVIVGGYLWIRHSQSTASSTSGGTGTGSTATPQETSTFKEWITQHNASPKKTKTTKTKKG